MQQKPKILRTKIIAKTRIFEVQKIDLEFSNGVKRQYECLKSPKNGSVVVVPMIDNDTVLMVYEYAGGTDKYELGLIKGRIDEGENAIDAANRELCEEAGFGARKLTLIKTITIAPGYQDSFSHIVLATDLFAKTAIGDEPEPLRVVKHKLSNLDELVLDQDLTEARSIAALYMVRQKLTQSL